MIEVYANRENGRVQCLNAQTGKFVRSLQPDQLGSTVYGIDYSRAEGTNRSCYNL